jgi:type IV secretory pathway VirB4 component
VTTADLRAAHLTLAPLPVPLPQVPVGVDIHTGAAFRYDPFTAYSRGLVTDASMFVLGSKGSGKSALVKSLSIRLAGHGRLIRYVDPKGETDELCKFFGVPPLRPGVVTINPLDAAAGDPERMASIAADVLGAALHRDLSEVERLAIATATRGTAGERGVPTLRRVSEQLRDGEDLTRRMPVAVHPADLRDLVASVANLAASAQGRMFLDESTVDVDPEAPFLAVDISGHDDATTRVLMVVVASWLSALWQHGNNQSVIVLDEVWRLLRNLSTARWLQHSTKMARKLGASFIPVLQHLSDLSSAGAADSETRNLARGLLADSEVRVIYRQPTDQHRDLRELLHLTPPELAMVSKLAPGQAIWRLRDRSAAVQHVLTDTEWPVVQTDDALGGKQDHR